MELGHALGHHRHKWVIILPSVFAVCYIFVTMMEINSDVNVRYPKIVDRRPSMSSSTNDDQSFIRAEVRMLVDNGPKEIEPSESSPNHSVIPPENTSTGLSKEEHYNTRSQGRNEDGISKISNTPGKDSRKNTRVSIKDTWSNTPIPQFNNEFNLTFPNDGPIVLITTNRGFLDFAENWLESVRRLNVSLNILAIAEDNAVYKTLKKYPSVTTVMAPRPSPKKTLEYLSQGYNVLINKRPAYVLRLLNMGRDVLFTDVDMVWFHNPLPHFEGDYDVVLQVDGHDWNQQNPPIVYCAGFIFFRGTNATRELIREWIDRIKKKKNKKPDQKILNDMLEENVFPKLKIKVLNSELFPSGQLYFDEEWRSSKPDLDPVIIHNNWIEGHQEKVDRFKSFGFWYL